MIAPVPVHCFSITFKKNRKYQVHTFSNYTASNTAFIFIFRKLRHRNIVEFHGVSYADVTNTVVEGQSGSLNEITAATLKFFFEYCNDTLENVVFNNESLKCKKYKSVETRETAFKYYITMATGICEGLAFIHERKYVHRDLKLSNVLVSAFFCQILSKGDILCQLIVTLPGFSIYFL